jgi:hypothetical protein
MGAEVVRKLKRSMAANTALKRKPSKSGRGPAGLCAYMLIPVKSVGYAAQKALSSFCAIFVSTVTFQSCLGVEHAENFADNLPDPVRSHAYI